MYRCLSSLHYYNLIPLFYASKVGSLTATLNYLSSKEKAIGRKKRVQAMGLFFMSLWGLFLVYVANSLSIPRPIMCVLSKTLPHKQLHALHLHTSILHKVTNVLGCGLLMFSNFAIPSYFWMQPPSPSW